ncbi:MAG: nicotinate phosphoribosyltransferase [Ectothiorhodospiraceae bacterium]|nr:nicotinate phosphoribosyltransferase [Chromatiales bacterium]MCP5156020.1 nicotinate phosphoribosyltransferase [Ectothiorhodospiraceae bacterium]
MTVDRIYRHSLALLTDLYELTMAYGYWKLGRTREEAAFHLFFRSNAFGGGYTVAAGLAYVVDFLRGLHFTDDDLQYLATLVGNDGAPLFEPAFLDYLRDLDFSFDLDAVPEGTVVFPHQPLLRVCGPLPQVQILETPLLDMVNFQTLVATKASRVCAAAEGEPVLEFGLRRAQGIDGALAASRAAYIGGCAGTSNVLAGKLFDIPVKGTHAHSWVMSFDRELESFEAYAEVLPNNCVFLVDTYDTLDGVRNAVQVGRKLRERGVEMIGVRLDSGDLAYLSIEARRILDQAGFPDAAIVGSNDLDEHIIASLKDQGAAINVWGVGTKLATAYDQPALSGVYKLTAVRHGPDQPWRPKVKLSEQTSKISTPGVLQVRRFSRDGLFVADMTYDTQLGIAGRGVIVDPVDHTRRKLAPADGESEDLLVPVVRGGRIVYDTPPIADMRQRTADQLARLHPSVKRFLNPHEYPAGLERRLHDLRTRLILEARGLNGNDAEAGI